jgi:hypothetical protein
MPINSNLKLQPVCALCGKQLPFNQSHCDDCRSIKLAEMLQDMQAIKYSSLLNSLHALGKAPPQQATQQPQRIEAPAPSSNPNSKDNILFYKDPVTGEDILCIRLPAVAHLHKSISYEVTQDILKRVGATMKQWVEDNLQLILSKLDADSIAKELEKEMARRAADLNRDNG